MTAEHSERPRPALGSPLVRVGVVTSTMDIARRLELLGAPEGTAVIAAAQTHGRGRSNRIWHSPPGSGLYLSVLLRPNVPIDSFQPFSVAVGLAICDALDPDYSLGLQLKWPNDIQYQGRKLAGILVTTALQGTDVASAIVGVGINLRADPAHPETSIALLDIPGRADDLDPYLERRILAALTSRYIQLTNCAHSPIADWPSRLALIGEQVNLHDGDEMLAGTLQALDSRGSLILRTSSGDRTMISGELTRGPRLTT